MPAYACSADACICLHVAATQPPPDCTDRAACTKQRVASRFVSFLVLLPVPTTRVLHDKLACDVHGREGLERTRERERARERDIEAEREGDTDAESARHTERKAKAEADRRCGRRADTCGERERLERLRGKVREASWDNTR